MSLEEQVQATSLIHDLEDKVRHETILEGIVIRVFLLAVLGVFVAIPLGLANLYGLSITELNHSISWFGIVAIVFVTFFTSVVILYLPARLGDPPESEPRLFGPDEDVSYTPSGTGWWFIAWLFIFSTLAARIIWLHPPGRAFSEVPPSLFILCGLTLAIGIIAIPTVAMIPIGAWWFIKMDRWRSKLTEPMVLSSIILALQAAQGDWRRVQQRVLIIKMLEEAAVHFENGFAKSIGKTDNATNAWLLDEIRKRAAGIRQLKRSVSLPTSDTPSQITDTLEQLVRTITQGAWGEVPVFEPPHERSKRRWPAVLLLTVRHLFVSFLPLAILSIARATGTELDPTISTYLWTSAIGWAVFGVILTVDPRFRDKLGLIKDLAGTWRTIHERGK